jgi:hypothetical protein
MTNLEQNLTALQSYYELIQLRKYNPEYTPAEEQIILQIQNQNIGSIQNFVVLSGLPKSGKSTFTTSIMASSITKQSIWGIQLIPIKDRPKICWFDTESSEYDWYRHVERMKQISNVENIPTFFDMFNTRKDSPEDTKKMIESYLFHNSDCSVVIVDGLLDLCMNYNDEVECRLLVNWLKRITTVYNILFITILHVGKKDGNTLGHLGSNTDRWAQSTLEVKKDADATYELSPRFLRSSAGFENIKIRYDMSEGKYVCDNVPVVRKNSFEEFELYELNNFVDLLFKSVKNYTYDNLIKQIGLLESRGINYSKQYAKFLKEKNFIDKNQNNTYYDSRSSF